MVVLPYSVIYYIHISGTLGSCFNYWCSVYWCSVYGIRKWSDTLWTAGRVRLCADYTISSSSLCKLIWRNWISKMLVRYMLPSVCLRLRQFTSLSFIQYMGLRVFSLPNSPVMIVIMCIAEHTAPQYSQLRLPNSSTSGTNHSKWHFHRPWFIGQLQSHVEQWTIWQYTWWPLWLFGKPISISDVNSVWFTFSKLSYNESIEFTGNKKITEFWRQPIMNITHIGKKNKYLQVTNLINVTAPNRINQITALNPAASIERLF